MTQLNFFLKLLKSSFQDLIPIIVVILFFQLAIIQAVPEGWINTTIGLGIVGIGLAIFLHGLEIDFINSYFKKESNSHFNPRAPPNFKFYS